MRAGRSMTTNAVTGNIDLMAKTSAPVRTAPDQLLLRYAPDGEPVGISCLARGADPLFAEAVLAVGGRPAVVSPSRVVVPNPISMARRAVQPRQYGISPIQSIVERVQI